MNASGIESIKNRTFNGLNNLQILHLEDNWIREFKGFEFERLSHLRELFLQNMIDFIGNLTFLSLRSLEILKVEQTGRVKQPAANIHSGVEHIASLIDSCSLSSFRLHGN